MAAKYSQYHVTFAACETNAKCSQGDLGGKVSKYKQEKSKLLVVLNIAYITILASFFFLTSPCGSTPFSE